MKKLIILLLITVPLLVGCSETNSKQTSDILNDKEIASSNDIETSQIFGTFTSENSWAFDPTITENLIDSSQSIVKIKVVSIEKSNFIQSLNSDRPLTPLNVEVVENLSGENLSGELKIYSFGGKVLISDLIKHLPQQTIEKMELNTLSTEQQNSMYISYESEEDYDFKVGKEYVVILNKQPNDILTVFASGYGIFQSDDVNSKTSKKIYKNILTGKELKLDKK